MGVVLASNGIGAMVAIQILTPIIYESRNPFGYRISYRLVAVILLAVAVIMMIFFKNKPDKDVCFEENIESKQNDISYDGKKYPETLKKKHIFMP